MEERNKRVWLVVGIGVVLMACCLVAAAATAGGLALRSSGWSFRTGDWGVERMESRIERTLTVGQGSTVQVDNFAGNVSVTPGQAGKVEVLATKLSAGQESANNVRVDISQTGDRVIVRTRKAPGFGSASVRIEISVPADTVLDLHTGAGSVNVVDTAGSVRAHSNAGAINIDGVRAEIDASTNAGNVEVQGAKGQVRMQTNAGSITFGGDPSGDCSFETNAGSIKLSLPADANLEIELSTNTGSISVDQRLTKTLSSSRKSVEGTLGDGSDGRIRAHTNAGSVSVVER